MGGSIFGQKRRAIKVILINAPDVRSGLISLLECFVKNLVFFSLTVKIRDTGPILVRPFQFKIQKRKKNDLNGLQQYRR